LSLIKARLINDLAPNTGIFNMAADDLLSRELNSSEYDAVIRIYRFDPPTVSLGRNQSIGEISQTACNERGWDIVRRPTGGRTLLHLGDICYSMIIPKRSDVFKDLRKLYEGVAAALSSTLVNNGIKASPIESPMNIPFDRELKNTRLCISARVRGEVHVEGRKITSASQRIYQDSILQHGSIFYNGDPTIVADIVSEELTNGGEFSVKLKDRVITMEEASSELVLVVSFTNNFINELFHQFDLTLIDQPFLPDELDKIDSTGNFFSLSALKRKITAV